MSWQYRVVDTTGLDDADPDNPFAIGEAFYKDGKIDGVSFRHLEMTATGIEELRESLTRMLDALNKPVLLYSESWQEKQ